MMGFHFVRSCVYLVLCTVQKHICKSEEEHTCLKHHLNPYIQADINHLTEPSWCADLHAFSSSSWIQHRPRDVFVFFFFFLLLYIPVYVPVCILSII